MNELKPIYTKKADCQDCYKCVRECPVKAIKIEDNSACIVDELCIHCGECVLVCPSGAKKIRNDVAKVRQAIDMGRNVILSVAPSWRAEFVQLHSSQLISAIKKLGFSQVSETAIGAQMVSKGVADLIDSSDNKIFLSTACPTVVEMMYKYYPKFVAYFTPLVSPLAAHVKYLASISAPNTQFAFVGPCAAKKIEFDLFNENILAALTFENLHKWFEESNIDPYALDPDSSETFYPFDSSDGGLYPIDGGMISGIKGRLQKQNVEFMCFSGIKAIIAAMGDLDKFSPNRQIFIELLACGGGCVNGPGMRHKESTVLKRDNVYSNVVNTIDFDKPLYGINIGAEIQIKPIISGVYSEPMIRSALQRVGKSSLKDELNCGSCGYDSCRDFAVALLNGKAMENMCASYMRKLASKKANALIKAMPAGVVIADSAMRIIECNKHFASIFGSEIEMIFEATPGLEGAMLNKIVPFYKLFQKVLVTGEDLVDSEMDYNNHRLNISVFSIERNQVVGAVIQDIRVPHVRREQVVKRVEEVIKLNVETGQKLAYLLGETASDTELRLNNVLEAFKETAEVDNGVHAENI
jgi:iron only hydrogenase large subunit-like protein/uncharacterized Fe-S cluster-containing protein